MCKPDPLEHLSLRHLDGPALDHDDRVPRAADHDIDVGILELLEGRVQDPVVADPPYPHRGDRHPEGDPGHIQRDRGPEETQDVGVVLLIRREDAADDLRLVLEPVGEEGTERTVDLARREDLLFPRPALALEEATGDLPGRV